MKLIRTTLVPVGLALGLAAEWTVLHRGAFEAATTGRAHWAAAGDFSAGAALLVGGGVCWRRRADSRVGLLLVAAGLTWFLGTLAGSSIDSLAGIGAIFVTLHRGPFVHALLSYPAGRLQDGVDRLAVAAAYVCAAVAVVGQTRAATLALAVLLVAAGARGVLRARGPVRRARAHAYAAALALAAVLSAAAIATAGLGESADWDILWAYQGVVLAIAVGLSVDLVRSRWADATLTGLVVELGDVRDERFLRERLASTLRDPSLAVGYLSPGQQGFVDEDGHRLALPESAAERLVTIVRDEGEPVAAIVHHPGSLADPKLADSVSDAVRIAVSNVRLQREIRRQVDDLEASRRRLVEAGDRERRRLERALHTGAAARLERVERALTGAERDGGDPAALAAALAELGAARAELGELAQGIHPSRLTEHGLEQALTELARRAPIPVVLQIEARRSTAAVETAAYFICSEALANIGKHADASTATIDVRELGDRLIVEVRDDGPGGATLAGGSGLRGLADRVETLDGRFTVESRPGEGTVIVAEFPGGS